MRCLKCGTPFCRRCHLGQVAGGLCTQCHHLFVVRDGVSGPARNQKLLEVQKEEARRDRVFRVLSLARPRRRAPLRAARRCSASCSSSCGRRCSWPALLTGRLLPLTEASGALAKPWGLGLAALVLLVVYVVANRSGPTSRSSCCPRGRAAAPGPARRAA